MEGHEMEVQVSAGIETVDQDVEAREILEAFVELELKDKNGELLERWEFRSESFVRQWLEMLHTVMESVSFWGLPIRDTSNTVRRIVTETHSLSANAGAANQDYGIQVGSGTTAPTIDDYALETQITHGVGAGQLQYSDMAIAYPGINASASQITLTRDFSNASGGAVTVNEVGLVLRFEDHEEEDRYFLGIRDVIGGGISVPDGVTLTVNYRIQASV